MDLKRKRRQILKDKCNILRDKISMNLYYLHRADNKLSGNKLIYVIRTLKRENDKLYNKILMLKCKGIDEIYLTMEPKF
jgi:hypothetical protein